MALAMRTTSSSCCSAPVDARHRMRYTQEVHRNTDQRPHLVRLVQCRQVLTKSLQRNWYMRRKNVHKRVAACSCCAYSSFRCGVGFSTANMLGFALFIVFLLRQTRCCCANVSRTTSTKVDWTGGETEPKTAPNIFRCVLAGSALS